MARIVALAEVGAHLIFKPAFGGYRDSEVALARRVLKELKVGLDLKCVGVLADGSWLAHWHPSEKERRKSRVGREPVLVRVIEYRLKGEAKGQPYRLITTLLDPDRLNAVRLAG